MLLGQVPAKRAASENNFGSSRTDW
jgi:hypothetical protein